MTRYFSMKYGWTGTETVQEKKESFEEKLLNRVTAGSVTDEDVDHALELGGQHRKAVLERMDRGAKVKKDLDEKYGKDAFDYVDSKGRPVKERDVFEEGEFAKQNESFTPGEESEAYQETVKYIESKKQQNIILP